MSFHLGDETVEDEIVNVLLDILTKIDNNGLMDRLVNLLENDKRSKSVNEKNWNKVSNGHIALKAAKAIGYEWMHDKAAKYFSRRANVMLTIPIFLSGFAAIFSFIQASLDGIFREEEISTVTWIVLSFALLAGILAGMSSIFSGINLTFPMSERSVKHKVASDSYSTLHSFIYDEMSILDLSRRKEYPVLLEDIRVMLKELREKSPSIPEKIVKKYDKIVGESGLSRADIAHLSDENIYVLKKQHKKPGEEGSKESSADSANINGEEYRIDMTIQEAFEKRRLQEMEEEKIVEDNQAYLHLDSLINSGKPRPKKKEGFFNLI